MKDSTDKSLDCHLFDSVRNRDVILCEKNHLSSGNNTQNLENKVSVENVNMSGCDSKHRNAFGETKIKYLNNDNEQSIRDFRSSGDFKNQVDVVTSCKISTEYLKASSSYLTKSKLVSITTNSKQSQRVQQYQHPESVNYTKDNKKNETSINF